MPKSIFQTSVPRDEVLQGELREQEFAASLTKVLRGDAESVYADAKVFFSNTYPTHGLQSLLQEAMGRLTGAKPSNAPIIRLETSFGGGKTHNLIALFHICRSAKSPGKDFLQDNLVPAKPIAKIAGIVGPDMGMADGVDHGDVRTYTIWGEIAYQIGKKAGYEMVRKDDEGRTDPGTPVWEKLIGDDPALIMIDELPAYLRKAKGIAVEKTTLAEQTVSFLMSFMKFVSESKRAVLVYTLADSSDAFGRESDEIREDVREARSISARQEHVLTPAAEDEISAIVSHRLFKKVDHKAAEQTADEYVAYFRKQVDQKIDLPSRATRSEYRGEIVSDYPFHPELLTTLNRKTSTIPNFQKTRGMLRLLALTVRDLWTNKPKDCYLIAPHFLNLGLEQIASDLTSRLDRPAFKQVIEADIASPRKGTLSHAQEVDLEWTQAGKPPYAQRVATAAFLHSLVQSGQSGVDPADLRLAVLQPDDARPSFIAWYRNPQRATPNSLRIPYKDDAGKWCSLQIDFVIISRRDDGSLAASIVDPHGDHLADAKAKLRALADFAEQYGDQFLRIQSVTMADGTLRSLDLLDDNVRKMVREFEGGSVSSLYISEHSAEYT